MRATGYADSVSVRDVYQGSPCSTPHFIRDNLDAVKANCRNRNVKADVDRVVALDDERKRLVQETQIVQQRQNEVSKLIPKEKDAAKKQELIAEGKTLREAGRRAGEASSSRSRTTCTPRC